MSENAMIKAKRLPDGSMAQVLADGSTRSLENRTDWARVDAMTEAEIEANAAADSDNPPLTAAQLARLQPVPNPKQIRQRLHLTQAQFAARFQLRVGTVRDWEQGVKEPDSAAKTLLRVIEKNPEAVLQALEQ
jgi:putative transcriptional regulator